MHIEPGLVDSGKIWLSYVTAAGVGGVAVRAMFDEIRDRGLSSTLMRSIAATAVVFSCFEVLPHYPVGISEVHLIVGSTLFLLFGSAAAAVGLAAGLLIQGLFFAPFDLPQYGMNVTTLLIPLFAIGAVARKVIPAKTPYVDLSYRQVLSLSAVYQAGVVSWVAVWAFYGKGLELETASAVASFAGAYLLVILIEPLVDVAVLAAAKTGRRPVAALFERRLYEPA